MYGYVTHVVGVCITVGFHLILLMILCPHRFRRLLCRFPLPKELSPLHTLQSIPNYFFHLICDTDQSTHPKLYVLPSFPRGFSC